MLEMYTSQGREILDAAGGLHLSGIITSLKEILRHNKQSILYQKENICFYLEIIIFGLTI